MSTSAAPTTAPGSPYSSRRGTERAAARPGCAGRLPRRRGVAGDRDLLDPAQDREPLLRCAERLPVGVLFSRRELLVHPARQYLLDEEVLLQDQLLAHAWRAQPGEQVARAGTHVGPAGERVEVPLADRDPADGIGPAPQQVEAEHRAPVVPDHGDVAQLELIDERLQVGGVVGEPVRYPAFPNGPSRSGPAPRSGPSHHAAARSATGTRTSGCREGTARTARAAGQEGHRRPEHRHRRERRSRRWPGHVSRHNRAPPVMPPVWPAAGLAGRRTVPAAPPSGQR